MNVCLHQPCCWSCCRLGTKAARWQPGWTCRTYGWLSVWSPTPISTHTFSATPTPTALLWQQASGVPPTSQVRLQSSERQLSAQFSGPIFWNSQQCVIIYDIATVKITCLAEQKEPWKYREKNSSGHTIANVLGLFYECVSGWVVLCIHRGHQHALTRGHRWRKDSKIWKHKCKQCRMLKLREYIRHDCLIRRIHTTRCTECLQNNLCLCWRDLYRAPFSPAVLKVRYKH